ncbi:MAG: alkyl hydroperoxide reductase [Proteobacteria bacterium]|nr:MAG: alkyl hydroperoxide reductase [Pseudomonadota bacterium]
MMILRSLLLIWGLVFASAASAQVANFAFQDIYGKNHRFSDFRGKWVVVNYWSTRCTPCISELPTLKYIAHRFRNKVVVLGMDAGETPDREMRTFVRRHGINYTVVPTQDSTMFALGLIYGVPTTYIVSPRGQIVASHMGVMSVRQIQNYILGK